MSNTKNRKKIFPINQLFKTYSRICPQSFRGQFEVLKKIQGQTQQQVGQMCALSSSALIPIENFKALFLGFLFLRFFKCCVHDKKKINEIATPFQRHYLQFCLLLSVNQRGLSKKMFKHVWQVVETIFFASIITFFVETCENFEFFNFFPDFVGSSRRKLYEK